jgi:hypothetical protein
MISKFQNSIEECSNIINKIKTIIKIYLKFFKNSKKDLIDKYIKYIQNCEKNKISYIKTCFYNNEDQINFYYNEIKKKLYDKFINSSFFLIFFDKNKKNSDNEEVILNNTINEFFQLKDLIIRKKVI